MKLEQQVCSLELSRKLKELGVKQGQSVFVYDARGILLKREGELGTHIEFFIDALTVAELGEMLPNMITTFRVHKKFDMNEGKWACGDELTTAYDETEANCCAKMLIYLLENKILTLESSSEEKP